MDLSKLEEQIMELDSNEILLKMNPEVYDEFEKEFINRYNNYHSSYFSGISDGNNTKFGPKIYVFNGRKIYISIDNSIRDYVVKNYVRL